MKRKIYIAGKVSGEPIAECTMKFGMAQKQIEALGYEAINPLSVVNDWHATWREAMNKCIKALVDCDGVLFLSDHQDSVGATIEKTLCFNLDMHRFFSLESLKNYEWNNSQPTP